MIKTYILILAILKIKKLYEEFENSLTDNKTPKFIIICEWKNKFLFN